MSRRTITIIAFLIVLPFTFERPITLASTPEIFRDALSSLNYVDFWLLNEGIHPTALAAGMTILLVGWLVPDAWGFIRKSKRDKERATECVGSLIGPVVQQELSRYRFAHDRGGFPGYGNCSGKGME